MLHFFDLHDQKSGHLLIASPQSNTAKNMNDVLNKMLAGLTPNELLNVRTVIDELLQAKAGYISDETEGKPKLTPKLKPKLTPKLKPKLTPKIKPPKVKPT